MATGTVLLPIGAATLPDSSANNAAPAIQRVKSTAGAPTPFFLQAAFDDTTVEMLMWSFRMPQDYASAPVLKVQYKMAATNADEVIIEGRIMAVSDGDNQDVDADAFAAANTSAAITVPGTIGWMDEISLALANDDGLAAGDFIIVYLARDADAAGDDAAGDMEVVAVSLEYTTT